MTCICVLGMHRSGTSCLTGIMQNFGVELGEVYTENAFNKRGNRENNRVVELNEALMQKNGGSWYQPVTVHKGSWLQSRARKKIIRELSGGTGEYWGFKDTRTLFTLDFWLEGLKLAREEVRYIGTFRHPHRVALSLNHRDNAPVEQCWELWHAYNSRLLELARSKNIALVDFDMPANEYLEDALKKLLGLGLKPELTEQARAFFDSGLRNQTDSDLDGVILPDHVEELYQALQNYNQNYTSV